MTKKKYGDRIRNAVVTGWSSKLFKLCYESLRLPCVWSFDKASWRTADIYCQGKCAQKGCGARIKTYLPHSTNDLQIIVENYKSRTQHEPNLKRRLLPRDKEVLREKLCGKSAFAVRNELAALLQDKNLPERPDIPTSNAMRLIRSRDRCGDVRNQFDALSELKNIHIDTIHKIGYDPFYAIFDTPAQSEYYARERLRGRAIISVDASGVGVSSPTSNPKCIFMYIICVHGNNLVLLIVVITSNA